MTTCKNCGAVVSEKFCSHCGQKASVGVLNFHELVHEVWHNLTHTDKGYLQLVAQLLMRPGKTISEYLAGKRKKYFNPFTFYLVTTSLLLLVAGWVFQREDALFAINNEFGNYVAKKRNVVLFFTLPVISVLLWLFFKNRFHTLAEAFTVMIFGFGLMNFYLLLINLFFLVFIELHYKFYGWPSVAGYVLLAYLLFSFLKPVRFWQWVKCFILTFLFFIVVEYLGRGLVLYYGGLPLKEVFGF